MVTSQLLTANDLWSLGDSGENVELIDGELVPMVPPGFDHGMIQIKLGSILLRHVETLSLGKVSGDAGFVLRRSPDTVLGPDLSFIASDRIPLDQTGFLELAPDLAVEIVSPGNPPGEIERELAIYLQAGVRCIWIVYPRERQVVVH